MTKLTIARRAARARRRMRRDLIHAAGCAFDTCASKVVFFDGFDLINEALVERIRIPRSIARHWGLRGKS